MNANRSVNVHQFAMVPRSDIPRSSFTMEHTHKTTFDAGFLIPIYVDEVLPGDTFNLRATFFARLATPLFPVMDNLYLDSFFFFVPSRLVWTNWVKFMGEQDNPGDSISYTIPQVVSPVAGYAVGTIFDYLGLPTVGQVTAGKTVSTSVLPLRAYNLIWKEWFRDQNLQNSPTINKGDGPDLYTDFSLLRRGKRHDYFTSCLVAPQKGAGVTTPLGTEAPVKLYTTSTSPGRVYKATDHTIIGPDSLRSDATGNLEYVTAGVDAVYDPAGTLYADLSAATAATINQLRQAFQIQRLLEKDARGGTRYIERMFQHFGVRSPDARLQRPEYLGGGTTPININPIAQTSATGVTGGTTPQGNLSAMGTALAHNHGFTQSFTEHGFILGLVMVRADLTYQQGVRRMWFRKTMYDHYFPSFAYLGEQAVLNQEIYCTGDTTDPLAFGYQERWAEMRYHPSKITGLFKSTSAGTIDPWHLSQKFTSLPALNSTFIAEVPPLSRVLAVGAAANGQQLIMDSLFTVRAARPMPLYSVPGLIDHF